MRRFLSGCLTLIIMGIVIIGGIAGLVYRDIQAPSTFQNPTYFIVEKGRSLKGVARDLEKEGLLNPVMLIGAPEAFSILARKHDVVARAGEYAIPARATMEEILTIIGSGDVVQRKITVPEGITVYQVLERVRNEPLLTGDVTIDVAEGTLAPETYFFQRNEPRDVVVQRMIDAQAQQLAQLWEQRAEGLPIETPQEALILASIVEKETGVGGERPMVAGVFVNRLRKGMRLQSDPTIIYGITGGEPLGRGIRRSEIDGETPYNTYTIDGLPPTPIANPGRAALEATLNPADTDALYFVADGTGGHAFAKTLREHNNNVRKWRAIENNQ